MQADGIKKVVGLGGNVLMMVTHTNNDGFTLMEIMVATAIMAVLSAIAIPNMLSWLSNRGVQSASRDLYSNMRRAQAGAVKRNRNCAITFNGTTGYTVYVDDNKNYAHDAGELVIADVLWSKYRNVQYASNTMAGNGAGDKTVAFQPNFITIDFDGGITPGTVKLTNPGGLAFNVVMSPSGTITLKKE